MDRLTVELTALGFQGVVTALLALVYVGLWRQTRRPWFATWACAWGLYALRLGLISAFIVTRADSWLVAHQAATGITALLLLWAALQFSRRLAWRPAYALLGVAALAWAWISVEVIHSMAVAGISTAALLSAVSIWTGVVFFRHRRRLRSTAAMLLAVIFVLWGLHHLDYPLLRPLGSSVLLGVFADVLFIIGTTIGTLFLAVGENREALEQRTAQLEQLTRLLLRAQEDERRRIARELHDEAGQLLTAAKIGLDLDNHREASELVARALSQVRNLSHLLRPAALDQLGLLPALRGLVEEFSNRTHTPAELECAREPRDLPPDHEVVIYRVVQEALTNVARHAQAGSVRVRLEGAEREVRVGIEDDGRGVLGEPRAHLGLLGMRERVSALGGALHAEGAPGAGFRIEARIPLPGAA